MRKIHLLHLAIIALSCTFIGTSCKKPLHSSNPIPNNIRLQAYTRITQITTTASPGTVSTISENYRFYYDAANRVSGIIFTSNDSFNIHKKIDFKYMSDSVYKTTTDILTNSIVERDTFIYNSQGQLTTAYMPGVMTQFQYYGKLLAGYTMTAHNDSGTTISASHSYTSDNGDFLAHLYDGNLVATLRSNRTSPFQSAWTPFKYLNPKVRLYLTPTLHTPSGYSDNLANYDDGPVKLTTIDNYGYTDTLEFPGELWRKESYHFYTEMANRTGDYLQIQSFTNYGYNIYQNNHLVEEISSANRHANISYDIDAYNKITQTKVSVLDSALNKFDYLYKYDYETY